MFKRIAPFLENVAESTAACLVTMVQGNLLALGVSHWLIASRTGVVAGVIASLALMVARTRSRWVISATLGSITAVADFFVHPGQFGPVAAEAVVTGAAAAALSYLVSTLVQAVHNRPIKA